MSFMTRDWLTLTSILRDTTKLSQLVTEILLIDDASRSSETRKTASGLCHVTSGGATGAYRARLLAVDQHVTNDVAVLVDAGVVSIPGWICTSAAGAG